MTFETFFNNILKDLKVELTEEFDRNFERKSFFGTPWAQTKGTNNRGSLMLRSGDLRKSIESKLNNDGITFSSSLPYASIHNSGGSITITPNMKKYFWARYYQAVGKVKVKKDGTASKAKTSLTANAQAQYFKSLALMKVGSKITIPQRQFLGHHPQIDTIVKQIVDENIKELNENLKHTLSKFNKK